MSRAPGTDDLGGGGRATAEPRGGPDGTVEPEPPAAGGPPDGADEAAAPPRPAPGASARHRRLVVAGLTAAVALPLAVALVAVRTPRWYPLVDLSQIEMRVRDVGTAHPPLVGLGGRIFGLDTQGSHPGPLGFYLLAPVYRLLGASSWALQASLVVLNVAVVALTIWAVQRRRGTVGAVVAAAGLALLMHAYGTVVLVYPWNPYMPVLFWALLLVCVWGVLCGDLVLLPIAVVAGSLCAQTHISYVGLVGGLGLLVVAALAWQARVVTDPVGRRRVLRWAGASAVLGGLLWLPVAIDEVTGDPGNVSIIVDSFRHPVDPAIGLRAGWDVVAERLDPVRLVTGGDTGSTALGLVLVLAWLAAAVAGWRLGDGTLRRLHLVVGAALVLGVVVASRILGTPWPYLSLWATGTAALALAAIVATALVALRPHLAALPATARRWAPVAVAAVAVGAPTLALTREAPDTEDTDAAQSAQLGALVGPVVDAIEGGELPAGPDGTFLVTWTDPFYLGGQGLGLLLELERRGYEARTDDRFELSVREHRTIEPEEADVVLHVATGVGAVAEAESVPGAVEVARHDPRTDEERATYEDLRREVIDGLVAAGQDDLVPWVDGNVIGLAAHERLPDEVRRPLYIMGNMPQPVAVFAWEAPS
ncbi:MAG: hypothetical protein C0P77_004015 [Thermoanaerobacterales bacterium]|nr:hypothetical protein [Thermoanaerobacterales bacterium]